MSSPAFSAARTRLPDTPALVAGVRGAVWLSPAGEVETIGLPEAARRVGGDTVPMLCHARALARRLGTARFPAYDLLELFAFVRPARFCVPTIRGLAAALLLPVPETPEQEAAGVFAVARALLAELTASPGEDGLAVGWTMATRKSAFSRSRFRPCPYAMTEPTMRRRPPSLPVCRRSKPECGWSSFGAGSTCAAVPASTP